MDNLIDDDLVLSFGCLAAVQVDNVWRSKYNVSYDGLCLGEYKVLLRFFWFELLDFLPTTSEQKINVNRFVGLSSRSGMYGGGGGGHCGCSGEWKAGGTKGRKKEGKKEGKKKSRRNKE